MSIQKIRTALETRLKNITPAVPTAFENAPFTPMSGVLYQRSNLLPNKPNDSQIGSAIYFERGIFQVTICAPLGTGPAACEARAQVIKDAFKRGTTMVESGVSVIATNAPSVSSAMVDGDRFCIPVSIYWQAQIAA